MPPLRFGASGRLGLADRRRLEAAHLSRSRRPDVHPVRVTLLARDLPQNELLEGHGCDLPIAPEAVSIGWTWRWPQTAATRCPYTGHDDLVAVLTMAHRRRGSRPAGSRARGLRVVQRLVLGGRVRPGSGGRFDHHGERWQRHERGRDAQGLL